MSKKYDSDPRAIGIIPARYGASRFPGKLLASLGGRTVIEHVYRRSRQARKLDEIYVATDDDRIELAVKNFGGNVIRTSSDPTTGTERIAEACGELEADVVVNIQGDEPFLDGGMVDMVVEELLNDPELVVVTLMKKIAADYDFQDPNLVKVVVDRNSFALYFSRSPIPHGETARQVAYKHIGLYGYRRDFLSQFASLPVGPLETEEHLEQLRVLENGYRIKVLETDRDTIGIDTPEDLERARIRLERLSVQPV
jgi:3-deoxy-manno-octulosonate cytidylyltransferase (CMP-KDO synthetase)